MSTHRSPRPNPSPSQSDSSHPRYARREEDFTSPDEGRRNLLEAKNYQAQLFYTIIVALSVAAASFHQASFTSASSGRWLTSEPVRIIRADPLYEEALHMSWGPLAAEEEPIQEGQIVWVSSGTKRRSANLAPTGAIQPVAAHREPGSKKSRKE